MKLLTSHIADILSEDLKFSSEEEIETTLERLQSERQRMLEMTNKVIIFLFTTLSAIAVILFSKQSDGFKLFGFEFQDSRVFIFAAFLAGNALYVVSTGLFFKIFIVEFLISRICLVNRGQYKLHIALISSYDANALSFVNMFLQDRVIGLARKLNIFVNLYAKYIVLILYGAFYYYTLISFLLLEIEVGDRISDFYVSILIFANVMTAITSLVIFMPTRRAIERTVAR